LMDDIQTWQFSGQCYLSGFAFWNSAVGATSL
jgi:hypothetical protein